MTKLRHFGSVLTQSGKDLFTDSGPSWAAAIAYYSLLSAFPLLLAAAAIAAYFVDPAWALDSATQLLEEYVPRGVDEIRSIVQQVIDQRGTIGLLSLAFLLWSGSRVFGVITTALNIAYDVDEIYGFWQRTLVEIGMLLSIGTIFVLALASRWLIDLAWNVLALLPGGQGVISQVVSATVPVLLLLTTFFLVYRFVPRRKPGGRAALSGAVVATLLFLVARPIFLVYLQRFGGYNLIYGSLAVVAILALWTWIAALILLFGGEVASHVQVMTIERQPRHEVDRRHQARAPNRRKQNDEPPRHP